MKKIMLCSLIGLCAFGVIDDAFGRTCGQVTVSYSVTQRPDHDEFLYANEEQYNLSKNGYANSKHNSGDGKAYECDWLVSGGCTYDDTVTLKPGHYFKGKRQNTTKTYKCQQDPRNHDDQWIEVEEGSCSTQWGSVAEGKRLKDKKTTSECSGIEKTEKNESLVQKWYVNCKKGRTVVCEPADCIKGYKVKGEKCVKDDDPSPSGKCVFDGVSYNYGDLVKRADCSVLAGSAYADLRTGKTCQQYCLRDLRDNRAMGVWSIETCPNGTTGVALSDPYRYSPVATGWKKCVKSVNSCVASRTTEEGKACCDLPPEVARWRDPHCVCQESGKHFEIVNGKGACVISETCETKYAGNDEAVECCNLEKQRVTYWVDAAKRCICSEKSKNWKYDDSTKTGQCVEENVVPQDNTQCSFGVNINVRCNNGNSVNINKQIPLSPVTMSCDQWKNTMQMYTNGKLWYEDQLMTVTELQDLVRQVCGQDVKPTVNVEEAISTLKRFFANAKENASVWKTTEGNFNGARLASDLTAGVVLGTVGGVVSANIIKKNQIKKGYEVLHCTIGGQTVADWGDVFNAGLR